MQSTETRSYLERLREESRDWKIADWQGQIRSEYEKGRASLVYSDFDQLKRYQQSHVFLFCLYADRHGYRKGNRFSEN